MILECDSYYLNLSARLDRSALRQNSCMVHSAVAGE